MSLVANARRMITRKGERVTLTKIVPGAPDPATPWIPGAPTTDVYEIDAKIDGVAAQYVDGTTVLASDLAVIASPKARHISHNSEPADGAVVDIEPAMADTLQIGGVDKVIKRIVPAKDGGVVALFRIFVAS